MEYGLIGEKLGHSFSKEIHEQIENYEYELKELSSDRVESFIKSGDFKAINVTIPYKEKVMPFLDYTDDGAEAIGAVNTIVNRDGKLFGYNTDVLGMEALFNKAEINPSGKKVAILGSGGTAKTARAVCERLGAGEIVVVSRTPGDGVITYDDMYRLYRDIHIIVNTTPCGMYPSCSQTPVQLNCFNNLEGVIDAIYNPIRTELVSTALRMGLKAEGGLYMLVSQAIFAAALFTGNNYPSELTDKVYRQILADKQNIVLVGMPASGKSTVGREIARLTQRRFIDTDDVITENHGLIPFIFEKFGEDKFRDFETQCISEISIESGCVIATGGGAILRDCNIRELKKNGRIYFLDRDLTLLVPTSDRPLASDAESIKKRYTERYPRYCSVCDERVAADASPTELAKMIINLHREDTDTYESKN